MDNVFIENNGIQNGIFFRSPIQRVMYDWMNLYGPHWPNWFHWILNIFLFHKAKEHEKKENAAGFWFYEFALPIYFKRKFRSLEYVSQDLCISSYGYEGYKEYCSGHCKVEKTKMIFTIGNEKIVKHFVRNNEYHYTYKHVVQKFIKEQTNVKQ